MTQAAKAQEPSMEEILASIRRIIADDDPGRPSPKPAEAPAARAAPVAAQPAAPQPAPSTAAKATSEEAAAMSQDDIDAMLAGLEDSASAAVSSEGAGDEGGADILDLTEVMEDPSGDANASADAADHDAEEEAAMNFVTIDSKPDVVFTEAETTTRSQGGAAEAAARARFGDSPLLSGDTTTAVHAAFNTLANSVLAPNSKTIEDLVKEMLRPMLKIWLDDNLPGLVERLVRAEIERVSRGG
jgi:cell pole-organizing protein PopZ